MRIKIYSKLLLFSALCILSLSACKKEFYFGSEAKGQLVGSWNETPQSANEIRTVYFGADDSFTMHSTIIGAANYASTFTGSYQINDNKLIIKINEMVGQEPNKAPVVTKNIGQLFDKATFKIDANRLTIDFVTYPADGPVPTRLKFLKN